METKLVYSELRPIDFRRYWENLSDEAKFQAFRILVEYPEPTTGDARAYLHKQVLEFKESYTLVVGVCQKASGDEEQYNKEEENAME